MEKTEFWYQKAADLGHAKSASRLEKLRSGQGDGEAKREESISRSESAEIDLLKKNPPIKALDNLAGVSYEEAFRKLSLRIKEERLSGKDCEELGYIDNTGGKINVKNPFYSGHESQMSFENEYEGRRYQLDFRNNMQADLTAMRVQCRFFYTVERTWRVRGTRTEEEIKCLDSSFVCGVGANKKNQMETKPFVLNSWATPSGVYFSNGDAEVVEAKAEGVWVRVIYTTPDGQKLQRDFCDPDSLSSRINWNGQSI